MIAAFSVAATALALFAAPIDAAIEPPKCSVMERGFDYVGYDMGTAQSPDPEGCCRHCRFDKGCVAFTWTPFHDNGTCYLKRGRGRVVLNPNTVSSVLSWRWDPVCQLVDGVDYVGFELARVASNDAGKCCEICQNTAGCRVYSWSDFEGGTCFLKSDLGEVVPNPAVKSAAAYPLYAREPKPRACNLEPGVNIVGQDLASVQRSTPGQCCDVCVKTRNCLAYTWTPFNDGTCWLKSGSDNVVQQEGAVSSVVSTAKDYQCRVVKGTDYKGNDIANFQRADAAECCALCQSVDGCKAYTWTPFNGGTCWLKSATKYFADPDSAAVSGEVVLG
ncbi:hypothetical protein ATCC90586_006052 [Pythium insidiosum]|nr:hypothetical protein ATCC90586_006052 [Pythium insidiosum]